MNNFIIVFLRPIFSLVLLKRASGMIFAINLSLAHLNCITRFLRDLGGENPFPQSTRHLVLVDLRRQKQFLCKETGYNQRFN